MKICTEWQQKVCRDRFGPYGDLVLVCFQFQVEEFLGKVHEIFSPGTGEFRVGGAESVRDDL